MEWALATDSGCLKTVPYCQWPVQAWPVGGTWTTPYRFPATNAGSLSNMLANTLPAFHSVWPHKLWRLARRSDNEGGSAARWPRQCVASRTTRHACAPRVLAAGALARPTHCAAFGVLPLRTGHAVKASLPRHRGVLDRTSLLEAKTFGLIEQARLEVRTVRVHLRTHARHQLIHAWTHALHSGTTVMEREPPCDVSTATIRRGSLTLQFRARRAGHAQEGLGPAGPRAATRQRRGAMHAASIAAARVVKCTCNMRTKRIWYHLSGVIQ